MKVRRTESRSPVAGVATPAEAAPSAPTAQPAGWQPGKGRSVTGSVPLPPAPRALPLTLDALPRSTAWASLPPLRQSQVQAMLSADSRLGMRARMVATDLLQAPEFDALPPAEQAAKLSAALGAPPVVPGLSIGEVKSSRAAATVTLGATTEVPGYEFPGRTTTALRTSVKVGDHTLTLLRPKDGVYTPNTQHPVDDLLAALAKMPPQSLAEVKELRLAPTRNPTDEFWATTYGQPGFQTYMNCGADGVVTVFPQATTPSASIISSTLVHETGHAWSMREWGDEGSQKWKDWAMAGLRDGLSPSTYANSSPGEDVAEAAVLYLESKGTPDHATYRALYPRRFELLDKHFGGQP